MAIELRMCPRSWNTARGSTVFMTSTDGFRKPFFSAGMARRRDGNRDARVVRTEHHIDTKANWTIVRVIGFGSVVRIDLEEVLVRAEVIYQTRQRPWGEISFPGKRKKRKTSLQEMQDKTYNKSIRDRSL